MAALAGMALMAHIGLGKTDTTGLNYILVELTRDDNSKILGPVFNNSSGSNAIVGVSGETVLFVRDIGFGAGVVEWVNSLGSSRTIKAVQLFVNSTNSMSGALPFTPLITFAPTVVNDAATLELSNLGWSWPQVGGQDVTLGMRSAVAAGSAKSALSLVSLQAFVNVDGIWTHIGTEALADTLFTRSDSRLTYNGTQLTYTPTGGTTRQVSGFVFEVGALDEYGAGDQLTQPSSLQAYIEPDNTLRFTNVYIELNG